MLCWGYNIGGELGIGTLAEQRTPAPVLALEDATSLSMSANYGCAITASGQVACWGNHPLRDDSEGAVPIAGVRDAEQLATSSSQVCALLRTGEVQCWGEAYGVSGEDPRQPRYLRAR